MQNVILALRTFFRLALPYFQSHDRWRACGLLAGVIGSELFVVYVAVKMNQWNAGFFNAIEARNGDAVRGELLVFVFITIGAILSGMGQYWFGQTLIIRWRMDDAALCRALDGRGPPLSHPVRRSERG